MNGMNATEYKLALLIEVFRVGFMKEMSFESDFGS